jgi:site-specific recombinase XerD
LPYPKTTLRLPVILSLEEVKRIIDVACDLFHRAILMTLYSTGMRCAELARLAIVDNSVFNIWQSAARKAVIQKAVGCHTFTVLQPNFSMDTPFLKTRFGAFLLTISL